MHTFITNFKSTVLNAAAITLLLAVQVLPLTEFWNNTASAAPVCTNDTQGANDEPGQKDLNKLCVDYANVPNTAATVWNWDETGTNGANTMDACNLFDTDNDGNINYAICVTTTGDPAVIQSTTTYSCGDTKVDRCTSPATPVSNGTTTCAVTQVTNDPFSGSGNAKGDSFPKDTQGSCTVQLSAVGGANAKLVDVCSYPSSQPNSDPSDCVIIADNKAKIEVRKDLSPDSDTGLFDLKINGTTYANDVGDNGTTGEQVITSGSVAVLEAEGPSTDLATYTTTVVCRDLNGTGAIVGQATPVGADTRQLSFTAPDGSDIVCIFTNTRSNGTITLIKNVINDNGGTATANNFGLTIGNTAVSSGQTLSLSPGSYTINETNLTGYAFVSITGAGCPAQLGGSVTLTSNQNITCTITNNDTAGQLKVVKNVVNDNNGNAVSADFTLLVNGQSVTQGQYTSLSAGNYTVSENTVSGYTLTGIACVDDTTSLAVSHPVALQLGQSVTCTVTNNDNAPTLTIVKEVINDNGGTATVSDFGLKIGDTSLSFGSGVVNGTKTTYTATPSITSNTSYTLSEIDFAGYAEGTWSCTDNSTGLGRNITVNLDEGENVTCTITNNDIAPKLTVVKTVENNNGGTLGVTDFPLYVGNVQVTSGQQYEFNAGLYVVSETNQPGYIASEWGGSCTNIGNITLQVGGVYTCNITNDDQPASIKVTKIVQSNNGGNAAVTDFDLYVNATEVQSGVTNSFNGNLPVTISEQTAVSGYEQVSIVCNDVTDPQNVLTNIGTSFTTTLGHKYECVVTNADKAPTLTIVKEVINDNGGSASISDFDLKINTDTLIFEAGVVDGQKTTYVAFTYNLQSNTNYTLSEADLPGYDEGIWTCTDKSQGADRAIIVNLDEGESVTCTITNNDKAGELIVNKVVINDNGGTKNAEDFSYQVNGGSSVGFEQDGSNTQSVNAGTYNIVELADPQYATTYDNCTNVVVANGETKTCTITNNDIAPALTLKKVVINDNGGDDYANEWKLTAQYGNEAPVIDGYGTVVPNTNSLEASISSNIKANTTYTLSEAGPSGYLASDWSCDGGEKIENTIKLLPASNVTCTITNNDISPKLTLKKNVDGQNGGNSVSSEWTLYAVPTPAINGAVTVSGNGANGVANTEVVANANYILSESGPSGYTVSVDWLCDGGSFNGDINEVRLDSGENVTCQITNTDIAPKLTLIKNVVNDDGGDGVPADWTLTATPTSGSPVSGNGTGVTADGGVQSVSAKANVAYTLTESNVEGYAVGIDWTCDGGSFNADTNKITLNEGEDVTCQITNNDVAPTLSLYKIVVDQFGDTATEADWTLYATPTSGSTISGNGSNGVVDKTAQAHMTYILSEDGPAGYTASDWVCTSTIEGSFSQPDSHATLRMNEGADVTCYITNTSKAPTLVVVKNLINDNGGTKSESDFTMNASGTDVSDNSFPAAKTPGTTVTLDEGSYDVTEESVFGYEISYSEDCKGTIAVGELKVCTVTNNDIAPKVYVGKFTAPNGSDQTFDFEMLNGGSTYKFNLGDADTYESTDDLLAGTVSVSETLPEGWILQNSECKTGNYDDNGELLSWNYFGTEFEAEIGTTYYCVFINEELSDIVVTKFHDTNENGQWDEGEDKLEGWDMHLETCSYYSDVSAREYGYCGYEYSSVLLQNTKKTQTTGNDGTTTFVDVRAGYYELSETIQDGWEQSNIYCEYEEGYGRPVEENRYVIDIEPGETVNCFVGNYRAPYFLVDKTNDQPNPVIAGTTVTYTLKVTVPEDSGRIYGQEECQEIPSVVALVYVDASAYQECDSYPVTVEDVAPVDFTYVDGSWTAVSSLRGNIKSSVTAEPDYGSADPAEWYLTNSDVPYLLPGEVVTLTYKMVIKEGLTPGTYQNVAHAYGYDNDGNMILANVQDEDDTPFVVSDVTVFKPAGSVGVVLGTSTVLVNSGIDSRIAVFAAATIICAALSLAVISRKTAHKHMLIGLLVTGATFVGVAGMSQSAAAAEYWTLSASKPSAVLHEEKVTIDFQVGAANPLYGDSYDVTLLQNGSEVETKQFGAQGGRGNFTVILASEGMYDFEVVAEDENGDSKSSGIYKSTYDKTPPASPILLSKTRSGDTYTITVQIPAGSECSTLEFFAATTTSFAANSSTLVGSLPCLPGQTQTFSFTVPGSEQYVAVRSVDTAGNGSGVAAESVVTVTNAPAVTSASARSSRSGGVVGDASVTTTDDGVLSASDGEQASETANDNDEDSTEENANSGVNPATWWVLAGLAVLGAGYYVVMRRRDLEE